MVLELTRGHDARESGAAPRDETEYLLRRGDGAYASARFPWSRISPVDLRAAQGSRSGAQARQRVGEALRAFLGSLGWDSVEAELLRVLKAGMEAGAEAPDACVTIRCDAAELCRLPLELLTLEPSGQALGLKDGCHVQWEWPGTESAPRTLAAPPEGGALLFAWSTAGGALDAAGQLGALQQIADQHRRSPMVTRW